MWRTLDRIWWNRGTWLDACLVPFLASASLVYRVGLSWDQRRKRGRTRSLPRPVLSVGNLSVGGSGKTPVALWLAREAVARGKRPCILTRGYGSRARGPARVDPATGDWTLFGDEPLLLARRLAGGSVYLGRDRWEAGCLALESEPEIDLFLLDDGFQHLELRRDFDLVLIDAEKGLGNGRLLPWGPLREPRSALSRAGALGWVAKGADCLPLDPTLCESPIGLLSLRPVGWSRVGESQIHSLESLPRDRPVRLLSGIASPSGFAATARECGLRIASQSAYPDHHPFRQEEIRQECNQALNAGERLATTAKDAVRLAAFTSLWTEENSPLIIEVGLIAGDGTNFLRDVLNQLID